MALYHVLEGRMSQKQFLADIYFGSLDMERLCSYGEEELAEQTKETISSYVQLSEKYPASLLEQAGVVPDELLKELKAIGFFGLTIPTAYGGLGLSLSQYLKAVEEIASRDLALAILSLAHLSIGTKGIVLYGNEKQKRKYLVPAASGEMIFSYALTEPMTGSDAKNIESTAVLSEDGNHYILTGQKTYITNANYAGGLTVFAQLNPGRPGYMGAFIVETAWDGVTVGKDMPKMGLKASSTAAIQLKDVRVPRENLLGQPGDGFKIAMTILNYGRLALGAGSAGAMNRSLSDMVKRSTSRKQFGVPISDFELVQEKMVRARVYSYVSSAMTSFTARMLVEDPLAPVAIESSHSKLFGTTRAWDTLYDALQVAGGSGYLSTQPYEKRMRDFRVTTIFEGTTEIHSIYPPLFVLRTLTKQMKAVCHSKTAELVYLVKGMFGRARWAPRFEERIMNRAARLARANARTIRWLLYAGLLFYGKKVSEREFFLRRITSLSLYLYGLLCILARVEAAKRMGKSVSKELRLLAYFVEEARQSRKCNKRLFPSGQELLHRKIVKDIIS
jgi:acyl-CoA dehydrogenase family protein 9